MSIDTTARVWTATSQGNALATADGFDVINPATGEVFGRAPSVLPGQLDEVFAGAAAAFDTWKRDDDARREAMRRAADVIEAEADHLAPILTTEQGKPLSDARGEFLIAAHWLRYFADLEIPREVIRDDAEAYEEVIRKPLGAVSAITPWNFPITLAMWKIAPALRAGNTLVVKPSPYTPMATLALGEVLRGILPDGVLNVVTGLEPLGSAMVSHAVPRKVSFTGSTAVGRKVASAAAPDLKRVTLELGGNDPAVILPDVDVEQIASSLFWSAFANNGQICLAVKRVYAHESIQPQLVAALGELAKSVRVGDGFEEDVELGPINNRPQFERVKGLVDDARARGARVVAGGEALNGPGYFYRPTVLDGVTDDFRVVAEEQFGPVLPVLSFRDEEDVIRRANASEYGLTASVWSQDLDHAAALAGQIDAGQVAINQHGRAVLPHLPFGGHKSSGLGVENGPWGYYSFTELQVIAAPPRSSV
ncbi:aldehyde dehydrogenase family protein [Leifsonia sp. AG29]|uniref:aldehyde dehydrogenase family protein n=1 Tax=Leifsonia sp. AG29 TaxID=2598860 RepID=UPI00131A9580|nr:aldehyde dehydrogenase family protein [Leifsonia sp. AG29]